MTTFVELGVDQDIAIERLEAAAAQQRLTVNELA